MSTPTAPTTDYWWAWCGPGNPPAAPPPAQPVLEGSGDRRFTAYRLADPPWGTPLQVAVDGLRAATFIGGLTNRDEFEDWSDSPAPLNEADLVLRLYVKEGEAGIRRLRGSYAVVVWDGEHDAVVALRDPMGNHPLFWACTGSGLVLSDSTTTLFRRAGVSTELNRLALADYLRRQYPDVQETFYAAVRRVPAGHRLLARHRSVDVRRTWMPSIRPGEHKSADVLEEFEASFLRATRRCLSFGRAGIFLSGGLDSVSVATLARDVSAGAGLAPPLALSLLFPDPGVNEEDVQRSVAAQLSLPMVMLGLDEAVAPKTVLEASVDLAEAWPAPLLSPWLASYIALGRSGVDRGCRAILTGAGGDEWLGVSPYLAADLLASFDLRGLVRLAQTGYRSYRGTPFGALYYFFWYYSTRRIIGRRLVPRWAPQLVDWRDRRLLARSTPDWVAPDPELRRLIDDRRMRRDPPASFYADEVVRSLDVPLAAMEQEEFFEAGRRIGMPILAPFFDPDLVEFLFGLEPDVLNAGGRSKGLVRSMLHRRFPDLAFERQKKVEASTTLNRLLADASTTMRQRIGAPTELGRLGVVDPAAAEAAGARAAREGSLETRWMALFQLPLMETFSRSRSC